jgi:hypothetical protein
MFSIDYLDVEFENDENELIEVRNLHKIKRYKIWNLKKTK